MSAAGAAASGGGEVAATEQDAHHSDESEAGDDKTGIDAWLDVLGSRSSPELTQAVSLCGSWDRARSCVCVFQGVPKKLAASMGFAADGHECFMAVEALYLFDAGVLAVFEDRFSTRALDPAAVYRVLLPACGGASVYKAYCQLKDAGYIIRVNRQFFHKAVPYQTPVHVPDASACAAGQASLPACVLFEVYVRLRTDYARSRPGVPMARVVLVNADAQTPVVAPIEQRTLLQACAACDVCAVEAFVAGSKEKHKNALQGGAASEFLLCMLLNSHIPASWRPRAAAALAELLPSDLSPASLWSLVRDAWPLTSEARHMPELVDIKQCSLVQTLEGILAWTGERVPVGDSHGSSVWHAVVDGSVTVAFLKALTCTVPSGDALLK